MTFKNLINKSIPVDVVQDKLNKSNIEFTKDVFREWISKYETNDREHFCNRKLEILNRINELNTDNSTIFDSEMSKSHKKTRNSNHEYDTFLIELDELENLNSKKVSIYYYF